jgi:alpha-L-rhamnosidase
MSALRRFVVLLGSTAVALGAVTAAGSSTAAATWAATAPKGLTVEHQAAPLAVEPARPMLGWALGGGQTGARQSAYQVRVSTSRAGIAAGRGLLWDSGKVSSAASANVPYDGPALASSERYWWIVRAWNQRDVASPWSAPASFGTAVKDDWRATPIWTPAQAHDYTVEADFTVTTVAAGIKFRSAGGNGFMWQIRGDSSNELRPHVQVGGTYSQLKAVKLPMTIGVGTRHHITIQAVGSTITTSIDGVVVDTTTDARNPGGNIGFRHGRTESATFDNVTVTEADGDVVYSNDFEAPSTDFACGTVGGGVLTVGLSVDCVNSMYEAFSDNWAFLRKDFTVPAKPVAWATAYVTARSTEPARQYVYKLSLNGTVVGVGPTRAKNDATTMYSAYDVTSLLRPGAANTIGALAYTVQDKRFQAQLVIEYKNGTRDVVVSDGSWQTFPGELGMPPGGSIGTQYYAAPVENIDARRYPSGFDAPGFNAAAWPPAVTKAAITGLQGTPAANVEQRLLAPVKVVAKAPGHYFLDFGYTVVGGLDLRLEGTGGEQVDIRLGEELSAPDTVRHAMRTGNTYRDVWTLRPGSQALSLWGYRVFRYAEVIGSPQPLTEANVKAAALVYPYREDASSFSSSSADLDRVHEFTRAGVRRLNLDLHLDSPSRERAPYEGDNVIHMLVQGYTDGDWTLSKYSMEWLIERPTWPTEWKFSSIISAKEYWRATGDLGPAREYYDRLASFLPTSRIDAGTGLVKWSSGDHLVDWPAGERDGFVFTEYNTVINAWSYRAYADMAELATALGNAADAQTWSGIAERLRAAINERLYDAAAGAYNDGLTSTHKAVHSSVFAVSFGVAGPDQLGPAADYVAGRGMACSVFCANFLIDALYDAGRADAAIGFLTAATDRSWLGMIAQGAGSPMEAWAPQYKPNATFSHPWSGSPAYLVYRDILGIDALEAGYGRFEVRPQPGGLTHAEGVTPTIRGPISVAFATGAGGAMDLAVGVPHNTSAKVVVPLPASGSRFIWLDGARRTGTVEGTDLTLEVGAGCHLVSTRGRGEPPATVAEAHNRCSTG